MPCPTEISHNLDGTKYSQWISNKEPYKDLIFSTPPCLGEDNRLLVRLCSNGSWFPSNTPTCHQIINDNKKCPYYLIESNICILITDLEPWDSRCLLNENITLSFYNKYSRKLSDAAVWLPLKRKVKYGPYEYVGWTQDYGSSNLNVSSSHLEDFLKKDCVVYNVTSREIVPEYCTKKHHHICPFTTSLNVDFCPKNCISAGMGTTKCFCKEHLKNCQNYATIHSPFDKRLLNQLADEDLCLIGDNPLNNKLKPSDHYEVISKNFWGYHKSSVNCSICITKSASSLLSQLVLMFDKKTKRLFLLIYSPELVIRYPKSDGVYCFTDASDELKKKLKVEKVFVFNSSTKERSFNVYEVKLLKYLGNYWCEAHIVGFNSDVVRSNTVLAYKKRKGHEYSLRVLIKGICSHYNCTNLETMKPKKFIDKNIKEIFDYLDPKIRVMKIFYINDHGNFMDILYHISTNKENRNIVQEYYKLKNKLSKNLPLNLELIAFRSSEYCLPSTENDLSWPLTMIGNSVVSEEICGNDIPPIRVCSGSFLLGAEWSHARGKCQITNSHSSDTAIYLKGVLENNITFSVFENITEVVRNEPKFTVLDLYYFTRILKKILGDDNSLIQSFYVNKSVEIIDSLLKNKYNVLKKSQIFLNSTDELLDEIDDILTKLNFDNESYTYMTENIIVHITNPFVSNISGLAMYQNYHGIELKNLQRSQNETFSSLTNLENLQLALYLPELILEHISESLNNLSNIHMIITIFLNDNMFISSENKSLGIVVSISVPGYGRYLTTPVPILFRSNVNVLDNVSCGYWDYGKNTERKKGQWSELGANYIGEFANESQLHICSFTHLTHFALLIMEDKMLDDQIGNDDSDTDDMILNILTFIGSVLTVFGITGIFITAGVFEDWRRKQGTKILLHISVAIFLECFALQLSGFKWIIKSYLSCFILGMALHYIVLSKFSWMLIYAFLQYLRFVKVLGPVPKNLVLKSVIFGWGFAIIPVLIVGLTSPKSYTFEDYHFCYPKGNSLYVGIMLPIVVVVVTNFGIFCVVMYEVSKKKIESHSHDSHRRQLLLATLLFFMLGLPYLFGLMANFIGVYWLKIMLVYIFCITATIQGFILFLFYVIFNKETKHKWQKYFGSISFTGSNNK